MSDERRRLEKLAAKSWHARAIAEPRSRPRWPAKLRQERMLYKIGPPPSFGSLRDDETSREVTLSSTLEDVADVLSHIGQRFCFVGHTHLPVLVRMGEKNGKLEIVHDQRIKIEDGYRYFVNVGSTGQPRDNNPDACVVIVDEEDESIEFLRVPYDISTCQSKILSEGLPSYLAERLILAR